MTRRREVTVGALAAAVALGLLAWLGARGRTAEEPTAPRVSAGAFTTASTSAADRGPTGEVAPSGSGRSELASLSAPGAPPNPSGAPRGEATPTRRTPQATDRAVPSYAELRGVFRDLFDLFSADRLHPEVTRAERAWAQAQIEARAVPVVDFELACSERMCRADLHFPDVEGARDLAKIRLPEGASLYASRPEPGMDEGVRLLVYWGVDGVQLGELLGAEGF